MTKIVIAMTGASGQPLAACLLRMLAGRTDISTGCMVSAGARRVWQAECGENLMSLLALADNVWEPEDLAAGPASGSWWRGNGSLIIIPCSMGTLGAIAAGLAANLIQRTASVVLKERLPLVLVPRETPLSAIHLRNMLELARMGVCVMPFSPAFYLEPQSIEDMLKQFCWRILDQLRMEHSGMGWKDCE